MERITLPTLPNPLWWQIYPLSWQLEQDRQLSITAGPSTDLFNDPKTGFIFNNSPQLLFDPEDYFTLSAKVKVDFEAVYDAGVLLIYIDDNTWAKLCFEFSPQKEPLIVSVVTKNGFSDDCNSMSIEGNEVYLRLAKLEHALAFHISIDGNYWHLIRYFTLSEVKKNISVGFSAQSPTGKQCRVVFSEIRYQPGLLVDIRSGE